MNHAFGMAGPQTGSLVASGTLYFVRPVSQTPYQSVQIVSLCSTGSTCGFLQLETSNVSKNVTSDTATDLQRYWYAEPSGVLQPNFTGSGVPCSQLFHFGNLGSKYVRLRADLGPGQWEVWWAGKA